MNNPKEILAQALWREGSEHARTKKELERLTAENEEMKTLIQLEYYLHPTLSLRKFIESHASTFENVEVADKEKK
jgi:hypothetical protein